jgi:hypothetical protein
MQAEKSIESVVCCLLHSSFFLRDIRDIKDMRDKRDFGNIANKKFKCDAS